jgi:solute carrier family 6 amino acid transporter-like protein 5/7/9/14
MASCVTGAFLVPYIVMLFAMGLPIFFLELIIGQYSGLGANKAFQRMAPIFHGKCNITDI